MDIIADKIALMAEIFDTETEGEYLMNIEHAITWNLNYSYEIPAICQKHMRREKWDLQSIIIDESTAKHTVKYF